MDKESTRVTVRLPIGMVKELDAMIAKGQYGNMSEAIADCIGRYLATNPDFGDKAVEETVEVRMESLVREEISMEELIRDAAKKFTKNKINKDH